LAAVVDKHLGAAMIAFRGNEVGMTERILIVGAGIAGLAAARTLAGAGSSAEVVEREHAWGEGGRASTFLGTRPVPSASSRKSWSERS
jgi:cation diffusion facilitator CzcD-associated flavoprotein CzcO